MNAHTDLNLLFQDSRFGELIEYAKTNSDIFEVLKLTENQHSDMLAWIFNPREGHELGDSVFKDFIIGIHQASKRLDCGSLTYSFGQYWTPDRIRATSFSGLYFFRELSTEDNKNRVDLVIVDQINRFVIVVENKTGTRVHSNQLKRYYSDITNSGLASEFEYKVAFVLLDMNFYSDPEKPSGNNLWAELNYTWMEFGASRAEQRYMKGNKSASLIMSYCRLVTDWNSEDIEKLEEISLALNRDYPKEIDLFKNHIGPMKNISSNKLNLFINILDLDERSTKCIEIYHQYQNAIEWLLFPSKIVVLEATLKNKYYEITEFEDQCLNSSRKILELQLPIHFKLPTQKYWPLFVKFKYDEIVNGYSMEFKWIKSRVTSEYSNSNKIDEAVKNLFRLNPEFKKTITGLGIEDVVAKFDILYCTFSGLSN